MKDTTPQASNYTCNDYRAEMILLGLQKQLARPDLTAEEKEALMRRIAEVEKEMDMA